MTRPKHGPGGRHTPPAQPLAPRKAAASRAPEAGGQAAAATPGKRHTTPRWRSGPDLSVIWGFHAVEAALRSERRTPLRLFATAAAAARLAEQLSARGLVPTILEASEIDSAVPRDAVHQGVVLEARPLEDLDLDDIPDAGTILVLDQITDPHNVGAILRTAAAFGVVAMVTTERHAPEMTGVLAKSASGGLEHVPIVSVVNLARALDALSRRGVQLIGLDSEGDVDLGEVRPGPSVALVLGAEGKGLRRLTRERCEVMARLDMPGPIKSLNVSNACAVALATLRLRAQG